jgi:hypothetical protein
MSASDNAGSFKDIFEISAWVQSIIKTSALLRHTLVKQIILFFGKYLKKKRKERTFWTCQCLRYLCIHCRLLGHLTYTIDKNN